jgi:hypothetical protein
MRILDPVPRERMIPVALEGVLYARLLVAKKMRRKTSERPFSPP